MGTEVSRTPKTSRPFAEVLVSKAWADERLKSTRALLTFRMTMVRLRIEHPDIFQLVESIRRAVDMDHGLMYDSYSQIDSPKPTKEARMGGEEE